MAARLRRPIVLLIESDFQVLDLLKGVLGDLNFEVLCAGSMTEARDRLSSTRPELAIIDLASPARMSCSLLPALSELSIPTIFTSGNPAVIMAAQQQGAELLCKPFQLRELLRAVMLKLPASTATP